MAFCPSCNAPQIRVAVPEVATSPSFEPGTPAEMQPPAQPVPLSVPPPSPTSIEWTAGRPAVLTAGILSGFCFFLPLNLVWIVGGGLLAVWLYSRRRSPYMQIDTGTGAKLGAVTGVVAYAIFSCVALLAFTFASDKLWGQLTSAMKERAGPNPEANVQQMFDIMNTAQGKAMIAVIVMVMMFGMFLVLGTVGGALGAVFARRHHQP